MSDRMQSGRKVPVIADSEGEVLPGIAPDIRLKQQLEDILSSVEGGDLLDMRYGVSSGNPSQSIEEAKSNLDLLEQILDGEDPKTIAEQLRAGDTTSEEEKAALRRMMYHHKPDIKII